MNKFMKWLYPEEALREQFELRLECVECLQEELHLSYHSNMSHVLKAMEVQNNSIKELMAEISELRSRIKYLENEVLLLDEDYQEFQAGSKTNFLNVAMRSKLKPKDLVSFPKGFENYVKEVEDLAEKTLTNLPG